MIVRDCTILLKSDSATLSETLVLYKGDQNIEYTFTLKDNAYKFSNGTDGNIVTQLEASYAQILWYKNAEIRITFPIQETNDGKVVLKITKELIDEDNEMGDYDFQIRLYDSNKEAILTLPPLLKAVHIKAPLFEKDPLVDLASADVSTLVTAGPEETIYGTDGNYLKTTWVPGMIITSAKLNKIETALYDACRTKTAGDISLTDTSGNFTSDNVEGALSEINSQIKEITNKVIEVNAKDFGASGDGIIDDTNSFSEFIDYINNNKDNIHKVVVPTGKYRINQGFRLEFLKDLQIIIEGEIITNGNDFLEFYFCENLKIKSNKISGKTNDDISLLVSTAIKFTNCCFIDFSFSNINNFKNAVYLNAKDLQPTHTLRGTYNLNITFDHINNCYNGIFILRENETAWINENRFFGGGFSGYNCIVQGDSNATIPCKSSEYNRNTFENISFEQIENNAITFYQSNCCVVKNCRPENPRVNEKYLIYEGLGAKSNLYDFGTSPIETNLIKMNLVDNVGSILIADIRKNTAIIGKKLYIYNSKMFIESCKISSESFEGRNICFSEDDYLIKIKNSDGVMKNYLKQNTLTYTITENDVDVNVSLLGSDNLTYREWQDDRIMITGRLKVNVETPKNTDLTLNLTLDSKLQPGISCYINSVAYNYATGESVAVCVSVLSNGHLKTNTAIPSGYIINFDSIVKKSYVNY